MCHVCRTAAPYAAESSPDDCLATALDNRPAEPAGTLERPQSRRLLLLGGAQLLELIDFCMHKIMRLHYLPRRARWRRCCLCWPRSSPRSWGL